MDKRSNKTGNISAQPHLHQHAAAIQPYGTVNHALPLELEEPVRLEMTERLNQLLATRLPFATSTSASRSNLLRSGSVGANMGSSMP